MWELTAENTLDYLRTRTTLDDLADARVTLLGWGVSNVVLRVDRPTAGDLVIKQSREQLRTKAAWFSRLDRIFREIDMLRLLHEILPPGTIPGLLFEDRTNYLFGMEAVPVDHRVWKQDLLEGQVEPELADRLGMLLGTVHRVTRQRPELQQAWGDLEVFDQLRVDPFYRYLGQVRADAAPFIPHLVDLSLQHAESVVLADFSPKNILLSGGRITLVDFETGHYGDPAFDLGFFLSHVLLKTIHHARRFTEYADLATRFWQTYRTERERDAGLTSDDWAALTARTQLHLAGCLWARVDGKSPVDYLNTPAEQEVARQFARELFASPPEEMAEWRKRLERLCQASQL